MTVYFDRVVAGGRVGVDGVTVAFAGGAVGVTCGDDGGCVATGARPADDARGRDRPWLAGGGGVRTA